VVDAVNTNLILLDSFGSCQEFVGGTGGTWRRRGGRSLGIWKRNTSIPRELTSKLAAGRNWLRLSLLAESEIARREVDDGFADHERCGRGGGRNVEYVQHSPRGKELKVVDQCAVGF
jgi:hypothetical protein